MINERKMFKLKYPRNLINLFINRCTLYEIYYGINDSDIKIFSNTINDNIEKVIKTLSKKEQEFIKLRYKEHKIQSEIAEMFEVDQGNISSLEKEVFFKLSNIRRWLNFPDNLINDLVKYKYIENQEDININDIILKLNSEEKRFLDCIYKEYLLPEEAIERFINTDKRMYYYKRIVKGKSILHDIWRKFYVENKKEEKI